MKCVNRSHAVAFLFLVACAPSSLVRSAQVGDRRALAEQMEARLKVGDLSVNDVKEVARATVAFEVASAKEDELLARLDDASLCARWIVQFLDDRKGRHDEAGARAATMLFEIGKLSAGDVRDWANDDDATWRALGVRGLVREDDAGARMKALGDPDPRVRLGAILAMQTAGDKADASRLIESARLDPDLPNRHHAVRAFATLKSASKPEMTALRDLWESADESLRREIATAWATSRPLFESGGREQLVVLLASGGLSGPAIAGAAAVVRTHRDDNELDPLAVATLERALLHGSRFDKVRALAASSASGSPILHEAVKKLVDDSDVDVRAAVQAQLAPLPQTRNPVVAKAITDSNVSVRTKAACSLAR